MDLSYNGTKIQTNYVYCLAKLDKQLDFIFKTYAQRPKTLANYVKKQVDRSSLVVYFYGTLPNLIVDILTILTMYRQLFPGKGQHFFPNR